MPSYNRATDTEPAHLSDSPESQHVLGDSWVVYSFLEYASISSQCIFLPSMHFIKWESSFPDLFSSLNAGNLGDFK